MRQQQQQQVDGMVYLKVSARFKWAKGSMCYLCGQSLGLSAHFK